MRRVFSCFLRYSDHRAPGRDDVGSNRQGYGFSAFSSSTSVSSSRKSACRCSSFSRVALNYRAGCAAWFLGDRNNACLLKWVI